MALPQLPPPPRVRAPGWFRTLVVIASIWMAVWLLYSWWSSVGVSCGDDACQSRADTGWMVLMLAQLVSIAVAVFVWTRRPPVRYWGVAVAALLPPITSLVVINIFYPPGFRF